MGRRYSPVNQQTLYRFGMNTELTYTQGSCQKFNSIFADIRLIQFLLFSIKF